VPVRCTPTGLRFRSCQLPLEHVGALAITTIEGIGETDIGKLVQREWLSLDVPQCGYCQGGQILAATALLMQNKSPSDADIDGAMSGNICRCGCYVRIRTAIKNVASSLRV
jgi:isoquinoline 1-oxidoreductase alpha subunit